MYEETRDPVFIVESPRSGGTFLVSLLLKHAAVGFVPESNFVDNILTGWGTRAMLAPQDVGRVLDLIYAEPKFRGWGLERDVIEAALCKSLPTSIAEVIRLVLHTYCSREFGATAVMGMKQGNNYIYRAEEIVGLFPDARFVHLVRDGRAVFASQKRSVHSERGNPMETDVYRAARRWHHALGHFDSFAERWPRNTLTVRYEDVVTATTKTLESILQFLQIDGGDLDGTVPGRTVSIESYVPESQRHLHSNVGKPPIQSRIDAWRRELPESEIAIFERTAHASLQRSGYSLMFGEPGPVMQLIRRPIDAAHAKGEQMLRTLRIRRLLS